jgi:hypothetical protein
MSFWKNETARVCTSRNFGKQPIPVGHLILLKKQSAWIFTKFDVMYRIMFCAVQLAVFVEVTVGCKLHETWGSFGDLY